MRLIDERQEEYGDAWYDAGIVLGNIRGRFDNLLREAPWMAHNWVMILSKLMRATVSPYNKDHWADIIGYAQLILDKLTQQEPSNLSPTGYRGILTTINHTSDGTVVAGPKSDGPAGPRSD